MRIGVALIVAPLLALTDQTLPSRWCIGRFFAAAAKTTVLRMIGCVTTRSLSAWIPHALAL